MSTDPWAQDRQNFVRTSKFKFSFWGLYIIRLKYKILDLEGREIKYIFLRDKNQEDIH
jgi:hypothetical protein